MLLPVHMGQYWILFFGDKLALDWTGLYQVLFVRPVPASPACRPLGTIFFYLDLPSYLPGR